MRVACLSYFGDELEDEVLHVLSFPKVLRVLLYRACCFCFSCLFLCLFRQSLFSPTVVLFGLVLGWARRLIYPCPGEDRSLQRCRVGLLQMCCYVDGWLVQLACCLLCPGDELEDEVLRVIRKTRACKDTLFVCGIMCLYVKRLFSPTVVLRVLFRGWARRYSSPISCWLRGRRVGTRRTSGSHEEESQECLRAGCRRGHVRRVVKVFWLSRDKMVPVIRQGASHETSSRWLHPLPIASSHDRSRMSYHARRRATRCCWKNTGVTTEPNLLRLHQHARTANLRTKILDCGGLTQAES